MSNQSTQPPVVTEVQHLVRIHGIVQVADADLARVIAEMREQFDFIEHIKISTVAPNVQDQVSREVR